MAPAALIDPLDDPHWIPAAFDGEGIVLVRVDPMRARRLSFMDGREPFAEEIRSVPIADFLAASFAWRAEPAPTILHVSFCGSTLLSRLLDQPGATIVYREPAIQIALADAGARGRLDPAVLRAVTAGLARSVDGARAVSKPSSWCNALLPAWADACMIRPVFLTMTPRAFLRAVFRGGRERLAYTLRLGALLAPLVPDGLATMRAAPDQDSLTEATRLALAALMFQSTLMRSARQALGAGEDSVIRASSLTGGPDGVVERCSAILGLPRLASPHPFASHAKAPDQVFSISAERVADAQIEQHHSARFDAALRWGDALDFDYSI